MDNINNFGNQMQIQQLQELLNQLSTYIYQVNSVLMQMNNIINQIKNPFLNPINSNIFQMNNNQNYNFNPNLFNLNNKKFPVLNVTFNLDDTDTLIRKDNTRVNLIIKEDITVSEMMNLFFERFDKNLRNIFIKETDFFFGELKINVNGQQKISELFEISKYDLEKNIFHLNLKIYVHQRGMLTN